MPPVASAALTVYSPVSQPTVEKWIDQIFCPFAPGPFVTLTVPDALLSLLSCSMDSYFDVGWKSDALTVTHTVLPTAPLVDPLTVMLSPTA